MFHLIQIVHRVFKQIYSSREDIVSVCLFKIHIIDDFIMSDVGGDMSLFS